MELAKRPHCICVKYAGNHISKLKVLNVAELQNFKNTALFDRHKKRLEAHIGGHKKEAKFQCCICKLHFNLFAE